MNSQDVILLDDGFAVRDLLHGDWHVAKGYVLSSPAAHTMYIGGRRVLETDTVPVYQALQAAKGAERSKASGNEARHAAGRYAMQIEDAHLRAAVLTLVEGWSAVVDTLLDNDPKNGMLYSISHAWQPIASKARCLIVTCPSTGAKYAHLVPLHEAATAKTARAWMMCGIDPVVET
jgi:hypothetical protein